MVALVVLAWRAGSGRMAVMVLIAVRSGLSSRLVAPGAGAAGSAPVREFGYKVHNYYGDGLCNSWLLLARALPPPPIVPLDNGFTC